MIEQVKELLKDKNVSIAVIVDDAYDTTPTADDLATAQWNSFFDDISAEDEDALRVLVGPTYDELGPTELRKQDHFVKALWSVQDSVAPAKNIFAVYQTTQSKKRQVLEPLVSLLRDDLGMTCHEVGRETPLPGLGAQVVFLDLYMGYQEVGAAMKLASSRVRELIKSDPSAPPSIILLSQSSDIESLAPKLRDDAEVLGCQFRWISKNFLKDPAFVAENIYDLVASHADAVTLNSFIMSWDKALHASRKSFMRNIRSLDLADYANVSSLILESEGEPMADYVLDIYDLHLHSLIEGDVELAAAAKKLNTIDWKTNYPPAQFMPSVELITLMDGALFHNQVRTDSYFDKGSFRTPRLGEVFLDPPLPSQVKDDAEPAPEIASESVIQESAIMDAAASSDPLPALEAGGEPLEKEPLLPLPPGPELAKSVPRYAYVVLSQACDLQHGNVDRILLLRGSVQPYSWAQHDRSEKLRTPIMKVGDEQYSIEWDTLSPETWLLNEIDGKISSGVRRARTFRMPFALQIQQAFIGKLGRVGTLAALPTRYPAGVKIFAKAADETAKLLVETSAAESQAVCLVGRTSKGKLEWLLLSSKLKETLRLSLKDIEVEQLFKETPGLRNLKSDPSFLRALNKGLLVERTDKGSRPLKDSPFDVVQILTKPKLIAGQSQKGFRGLVIEIDFGDVN